MRNAIEIEKLNKTYKASGKSGEKMALRDIDLAIPRGSIFGLLGPNGAGKSTIINIMAGLVKKTSGTVRIWGNDIDRDERNAKASIGIVPQEITFDPFFTPLRMLDIQAGMYGVPENKRRSQELLELVGLREQAQTYARRLSGGMKRRLMIAKALVHTPPILVLDEPTAGVDVELRQMLWERVRMLQDQGVTILLTTHYLEEAEELCDTIAIINHGRIVACEPKETLLARIDAKEIRFRLDQDIRGVPAAFSGFHPQIEGERTLRLRYTPGEHPVGHFLDILQAEGYGVADISTDESSLEDVFLQMTKRA